jgi:twitching motility protein PilT
MVGEMREPEVMRLTLNAAETGHLVFTTVHSGSSEEAIYRLVNAFPAEMQDNVRAQIADCLLAIICQRLVYRPDINMRVPECEILNASFATKSIIRSGKYSKIRDILQTGSEDKMWSFQRYKEWLDNRKTWYFPENRNTEKPVDLNINGGNFNTGINTGSRPASDINVPVDRRHILQDGSKSDHEALQAGVYRIDEDDDIDTVLRMFDKPEK